MHKYRKFWLRGKALVPVVLVFLMASTAANAGPNPKDLGIAKGSIHQICLGPATQLVEVLRVRSDGWVLVEIPPQEVQESSVLTAGQKYWINLGQVPCVSENLLLTVGRTVEQKARLSADVGTIAAIRAAIAIYYGRHNGKFPTSKTAVVELVTPKPQFLCPGNDFEYDPRTGEARLLVEDHTRC